MLFTDFHYISEFIDAHQILILHYMKVFQMTFNIQFNFSKQASDGTENFGEFKGVARLQRLINNGRYYWGFSNCDRFTEVGQFLRDQFIVILIVLFLYRL